MTSETASVKPDTDDSLVQEAPAPPEADSLLLRHTDLLAAADDGIVTRAQAEALWQWGLARAPHGASGIPLPVTSGPMQPVFNFTNVLYYFGGLLAIGAMTLFMTLTWTALGAWGFTILGTLYLIGVLAATHYFLRQALPTPAGLLGALAVCLVPLIAWGAQHALGLWPAGDLGLRYGDYHVWIDRRWLFLELATLAAGVVMLCWLRLPFMVMPLAVTLWYMSMDVANLLMKPHEFDWHLARTVSLIFGLATIAIAVWVDSRTRRAASAALRQDFAYWLYLFGAIMAWAGLTLQDSSSELGKLAYALINAVLVFFGAAIGRRVFTVLGALGMVAYLGHLAWNVFKDSLLFPFFLTVIGLAVIGLGVWWQRHEQRLQQRLSAWVPAGLRPR